MSRFTLKTGLLTAGFIGGTGLILLGGCGGSGGSSSGSTDSTLDKANIEKLASRIVNEGNCIAVSGATAARIQTSDPVQSTDNEESYSLQERSIYNVTNGLLGGSLVKEGEHHNGTDTMTYTYTNFTNPVGDHKFTADGKAAVVDHGTPGEFGPVMSNKTVDTSKAINITKESNLSNRDGLLAKIVTGHYKLDLSGLNRTYTKKVFYPDDFVIKKVTLLNTDTNDEFRITNLSGKGYFNSAQAALTDVKYTYTSPDVGTLTIKSDSLVIALDSMKIPSSMEGTLTLTATDDTQAEMVVEGNGTIKIFTVDGAKKTLTSEVNCNGLVH